MAYNVAGSARSDAVIVDGELHKVGDKMTYLYPKGKGTTTVKQAPSGAKYVILNLDKHQFAILK